MPKRLSYILLICTLSQAATAQIAEDTISRQNNSDVINIYYQSLGEQSPLYNGSQYLEYAFSIQEGHPFFGVADWVKGEIIFDGMQFQNVPMLYDIIKDQVIILDFQKIYKINLPPERIQQFTLSNHTFVHLMHDSLNGLRSGFYDQLYNKRTALFVKREKRILQRFVDLKENDIVISESIYYIRKDGRYHTVKNRGSLFDVLKDKKKGIQQYLKKQGIKFKNEPEKAMVMALEYYDQLTN